MNENSCCVHFFLNFLHSVTAQVNHIPHLPLPQRRSLSKERELLKPPSCHSLPLKGNFYVCLFYCS